MGIKGNKVAAKEWTEVATSRLLYTDYFPTIRRPRNFDWQRKWDNSTS